MGFTARTSRQAVGELLPRLSILTAPKCGGISLLHSPWSRLHRPLAGILPCGARTFLIPLLARDRLITSHRCIIAQKARFVKGRLLTQNARCAIMDASIWVEDEIMKRFIAMLLILCSALLMTAAFAEETAPEAKITVVEQRFINMEDDGRGFFFAKVQNTGDAAGYVDYKGNIVASDAEGNIILTENYVSTAPDEVYLEPGEYAYVRENIYDDALDTAEVADCKFSIRAVDDGEEYEKLASEAKIHFEPDEEDDNYVDVTFTNTTDEILYDYEIVAALYDQNGELLFINTEVVSGIGVHPGSTITVRLYIYEDILMYFCREGLTPTTVDALVYCEK